jgi:phosphoinositide-3-kinase, regulatory subunit 4
MGNKIARTTQASATEYYLHDLSSTYNLVLLNVVSRSRFLKSVRCNHDEGLLLVKVYFKCAGESIDLKVIHPRPPLPTLASCGLRG